MTAMIEYTREQVDLIKRIVAPGSSHDELAIFLHACEVTGLDPLTRQIYALKRRVKDEGGNWVEKLSIQTGIDGYRLIADRTGRYAPGPEPKFSYDSEGNLVSATAFVRKQTADGTWHTVAAAAYYAEYVVTNRDGQPSKMWLDRPHIMLAKCAEALALRRAFPAELSSVYTREEIQQAEIDADDPPWRVPALAAPEPEGGTAKIPSNMPTSGAELLKRLTGKDEALAADGLCEQGDLLTHVAAAGNAAGYGTNLATWPREAMMLAVEKVREFEAGRRAAIQKIDTGTEAELLVLVAKAGQTIAGVRHYMEMPESTTLTDLTVEQATRLKSELEREIRSQTAATPPARQTRK